MIPSRALARAIRSAAETGHLTPGDVSITARQLRDVPNWRELVNPWAVGLGNPCGSLVVVGWGKLASLIALAWGGDARQLLGPKTMLANPAERVFDLSYVLDLSSLPAKAMSAGATALHPSRESYLSELLQSVEKARVLLFHGRPRHGGWDAARMRLGARFLGLTVADFASGLIEEPVPGENRIKWIGNGSRGVLFTVHLTHAVGRSYWDRVGAVMRSIVPKPR